MPVAPRRIMYEEGDMIQRARSTRRGTADSRPAEARPNLEITQVRNNQNLRPQHLQPAPIEPFTYNQWPRRQPTPHNPLSMKAGIILQHRNIWNLRSSHSFNSRALFQSKSGKESHVPFFRHFNQCGISENLDQCFITIMIPYPNIGIVILLKIMTAQHLDQ